MNNKSERDTICKINEIPNVLLRYLGKYSDIDSLMCFSSTNKKLRKIFEELRKIYVFLNQSGFVKNFEKEFKKKLLLHSITNKDFSCLFDNTDKSPLHYACQSKEFNLEMIQKMIDYKCNLNRGNKYKLTPLHAAANNNRITLKNKANLNLENSHRMTALHLLCKNESATPEIIKYMIENKSSILPSCDKETSPLHFACQNQNLSPDIVKYLVESKSNLNLFDKISSRTPLHHVCSNKKVSFGIIESLVESKSNLNLLDDKNNTFACCLQE